MKMLTTNTDILVVHYTVWVHKKLQHFAIAITLSNLSISSSSSSSSSAAAAAVVFSLYFWSPRALDVGRHSKFMLIDWLIDHHLFAKNTYNTQRAWRTNSIQHIETIIGIQTKWRASKSTSNKKVIYNGWKIVSLNAETGEVNCIANHTASRAKSSSWWTLLDGRLVSQARSQDFTLGWGARGYTFFLKKVDIFLVVALSEVHILAYFRLKEHFCQSEQCYLTE